MVRSVARGQFRVTSAWDALPPLQRLVETPSASSAPEAVPMATFHGPPESDDGPPGGNGFGDGVDLGLPEGMDGVPALDWDDGAEIEEADPTRSGGWYAPEATDTESLGWGGRSSGPLARPPGGREMTVEEIAQELGLDDPLAELPGEPGEGGLRADPSPGPIAPAPLLEPILGGLETPSPRAEPHPGPELAEEAAHGPEPSRDTPASPPTVSPPASGSSSPAAVPPNPSSAGAGDPSRTLAALLARMWLVRAAQGAAPGGVALSNAAAPTAAGPTPVPASTSPSPASTVPEPEPAAPPVPAARPPVLPPGLPLMAPVPLLAPIPRGPGHLPDDDDRHPISGLGTFVIEVAAMTRPPVSPEAIAAATPSTAVPAASAPAPPVGAIGRLRLVYRLVHCDHPIREQDVSHDSCRQWRVGRLR